ncbi:hypothetical protein CEXT_588541 [Caerostris extrusa]|uniref:Uncharacterized protein n=1 Tax=Caerostris extrusa TaxID=172846 RepID=A0AAV4UBH4_CAEEX|nr:hypothetical protein CEXT_588541 [Caerostris extrusa]
MEEYQKKSFFYPAGPRRGRERIFCKKKAGSRGEETSYNKAEEPREEESGEIFSAEKLREFEGIQHKGPDCAERERQKVLFKKTENRNIKRKFLKHYKVSENIIRSQGSL